MNWTRKVNPVTYPISTNDPFVVSADSCETVGSAPNLPNVYPPIYQPGSKHKHYTFDCSQNPATNGPPVAITFTVGSVYWNPHLPAQWTNAGSFSSTASVYVTSSDPTLCASPGWIAVDPNDPVTTWNIVTTNCSENNLTLPSGSQWQLIGLGFAGEPAGGGVAYQFDGFTMTYSATIDLICICGCTTNQTSGTRDFSYTQQETIECYNVGSNGITVALPTEIMGAIGELIASQIADNIPTYGVDASYLTDIVNAINANIPTTASAGAWQGGISPCGN